MPIRYRNHSAAYLAARSFLSPVAYTAISCLSRTFNALNAARWQGKDRLRDAVYGRAAEQPLITISNHVSVLDDPLMHGWQRLPLRERREMRWTLGAREIIYESPPARAFFGAGRVIPTVRGAGVDQRAVDVARNQLARGGWVHIFCEGRVNENFPQVPLALAANGGGYLRWGVGKLVAESPVPPVVVPIGMAGYERCFGWAPFKFCFVPRLGQTLAFAVGEPVEGLESMPPGERLPAPVPTSAWSWRERSTAGDTARRALYSRNTAVIQGRLAAAVDEALALRENK